MSKNYMRAILNRFVKELTEQSFQGINNWDEDGNTILFLAVEIGDVEVVKLLIENGANVNVKNKEGETPLHIAALIRKTESVKALLEAGAEVDEKNNSGQTPLHFATLLKRTRNVKILIKAGANVNTTDYYYQHTPMHVASAINADRAAKALIKAGASINVKNKFGETPLRCAKVGTKVAKLLEKNEGKYIVQVREKTKEVETAVENLAEIDFLQEKQKGKKEVIYH